MFKTRPHFSYLSFEFGKVTNRQKTAVITVNDVIRKVRQTRRWHFFVLTGRPPNGGDLLAPPPHHQRGLVEEELWVDEVLEEPARVVVVASSSGRSGERGSPPLPAEPRGTKPGAEKNMFQLFCLPPAASWGITQWGWVGFPVQLEIFRSSGGAKVCSDHRLRAPPAYTAQWLTLHQHRANDRCRNRCKFLNIDSLSHRLVVGLLIKAIQTL